MMVLVFMVSGTGSRFAFGGRREEPSEYNGKMHAEAFLNPRNPLRHMGFTTSPRLFKPAALMHAASSLLAACTEAMANTGEEKSLPDNEEATPAAIAWFSSERASAAFVIRFR